MRKGKPLQRTIQYQHESVPTFPEEVKKIPGGETLLQCIQCGTCSAACPVSIYMDYTPRKIIGLIREGFKEEALSCLTIWLCASCYGCAVECPKEIKITDVMYHLKQIAIREGKYPPRFPTPNLSEAFFENVRSHGKSNELKVIMKVYWKTGLWKHINKAFLGLKLFLKGRMKTTQEKIQNIKQLQTILDAIGSHGKIIPFSKKEVKS